MILKFLITYIKTEENYGIHIYLCRELSEIKNLTSSHGKYMSGFPVMAI